MRRFILQGGAVAAVLSTGMAGAATYEFAPVVDNAGPISQINNASLNNAGSTMVESQLDTGSNSIDVYGPGARNVGFGGAQAQTPYFNVAFAGLNNVGQVAFNGITYTPTGWHLRTNTAGVETTNRSFANTDTFGNLNAINDTGAIAYRATVGATPSTIYRTVGTTHTTMAQVGVNGFQTLFDPSINNPGNVAFRANRSGVFGLYVSNGATLTTIADPSGPIQDISSLQPAFNDAGQVAFTASLDAGGEALYVGNGTTLTPLLDTSGPFEDLSWTAINALGQVAFAGTLDGGTTGGVYMALGGGAVEKVIGIGDPLFGSTVTSVFMKTDALNDSGQIALIYRLATGVRGVAVATPVPEPHALGVVLAGVSLLACRRRR